MMKDQFYVGLGGQWRPRLIELALPAPEGMRGKTLLFATDLHIGDGFAPGRQWDYLLQRIRGLDADMICWGGDFAEGDWHNKVLGDIATLKPRSGQYSVIGNNDRAAYFKQPKLFKGDGFRMLLNEVARAQWGDCEIGIAGVDDPREGRPDLSILKDAIAVGGYSVLIAHSPLALQDLPKDTGEWPDLILCGHTHGGQLRAFGISPYTFGYEKAMGKPHFQINGVHKIGEKTTLVVSNGIGTSLVPLRIGAPPQLHLIKFIGL